MTKSPRKPPFSDADVRSDKKEGTKEAAKRLNTSRCSPTAVLSLFQKFTAEQRQEIEDMGFAGLASLADWKVKHKLFAALAKTYNTETHTLDAPAITFKVTPELVGKALGLPYTAKCEPISTTAASNARCIMPVASSESINASATL